MYIDFFMKEAGDYDSMYDHLPVHIVEHIRQHMDHIRQSDMGDRPWWINTSTGKFSVKSAWEILRNKEAVSEKFKKIWVQDLPFKISFFSWRVWTNRVPVAIVIANWNPNQSQLCLCCTVPARETIEHLLLKGEISIRVWQYFSSAAGILRTMDSIEASY